MSEALRIQCEKIEEDIDKLSNWEKEFYLYTLLPNLAEKYRRDANLMDPKTSIDGIAKHELFRIASLIDAVRESLVYDLF